MTDDGAVERRVRLLRPAERNAIALDALAETNWETVDQQAFAAAWATELATVPEFSTATFHIVTGLLLPIWKPHSGRGLQGLSALDRRGRAYHWPRHLAGGAFRSLSKSRPRECVGDRRRRRVGRGRRRTQHR
jgi:hypothetical protein